MKIDLITIGVNVFRRLTKGGAFKMSKERLEKEMEYLNKLPEPEDDIARSYNQYLCQMYHLNFFFQFIFNILAFLLLLPTIFFFFIRNKGCKSINDVQAVFLMPERYIKLLPRGVVQEFEKIICNGYGVKLLLEKEDIRFIWRIVKCKPFSYFFVYKLLLRLALYRGIINRYRPVAIITASEYSFLSSMLTKYCEYNNVMHIDVMHGERFLEIGSSFFRFTRCYVWDEYYINIFKTLRAYDKQFIVEVPPALEIQINEHEADMEMVDFKYYLTNHTKEDLRKISLNINKLLDKGYKVKIRPHPLFCTENVAKNYFAKNLLENPQSVSIEHSLSSTKKVLGVDSTVLFQAYLCGRHIVFDDMVYARRLDALIAYKYILLCRDMDKDYLSHYIA